jgi:hypothetical protein
VKIGSLILFRAIVAIAFLMAAPLRALDLTPHEGQRILEGVRIPLVTFTDPVGRIIYQPPVKWNCNGGGTTFELSPPEISGASMKLLVVKHAPGAPATSDFSSPDLVKWAQRFLASDAAEVKLLSENPNPFMLSRKPTREFVFDYKSSAQRVQTSVAVLDWSEREYLVVIITALSSDFTSVHDTGTGSMFSWDISKANTDAASDTASPSPGPQAAANAPTIAPGPTPIKAARR